MGASSYARTFSGGQPQRTAAQLNGVNGFIELGDNNHFVVVPALVLEVIAQPTNLTSGQVYIELTRNQNSGVYYLFSFQDLNPGADTGTLSFGLETDAQGYAELDVPIRISDYQNKLRRYVARYDGAAKYLYTCLPGGPLVLLGSAPCAGNAVVPGQGNIVGSTAGQAEFLGGLLSDFRRWSVDRSPAQLHAYAFKRLPQPTQQRGLEAYYPFDEPAGATLVRDRSSYKASAQIRGGQQVSTPTFLTA